jgi:acyl transferase domain-containing protein
MTAPALGSDHDVAVVGMAGRFSGANSLESFWENLRAGVVSISFFDGDELARAGVDAATLADPAYVKAAPVLDDVDCFDAAFFGYSPREATIIDPQQRLLLECAWEAMEDAGYSADAHPFPVGVYAGSSLNTYFLATGLMRHLERDFVLTLSSSDKDFLATRIAYKLNLEGPALTVQCACSTSLAAVHVACQALLSGECDVALAGGVCVKVPQRAGYFWHDGGIVSRDGHVRPFDASATGTVFGGGAGIVVLRRLSDALADGDTIRAVIKGSAVNNDGAAKASFTAPSVDKQAEVIVEALARANVPPETVSYVEAHGTGTALGDPIELAALTKAWRTSTDTIGTCAIGSVKANIGHVEAASGIVGLIKTVLALEHRELPPLAEWEAPNPACDLASSPFFVNTALLPWTDGDSPRRAGISSLGVGGTNVHVVVEEAPDMAGSNASRAVQLLPVSARTDSALAEVERRLADALERRPELELADVAFTLQAGRKGLARRDFAVASGREEAMELLTDEARPSRRGPKTRSRDLVFVFPADIGECDRQVQDLCEEHAFSSAFRRWDAGNGTARTFAVEYALAQLWLSWGLRPTEFVSQGVGAAAEGCLRGSWSPEEALRRLDDTALSGRSHATAADHIQALHERDEVAFLVLGSASANGLFDAEGLPAPQVSAASLADSDAPGAQTRQMLAALGTLWAAGVDVAWDALHAGSRRHRVRLPTYPFERERFWWEEA